MVQSSRKGALRNNAMHELQHRKGSNTRDRILDVAEAAILEKGFAATSIDELIAAVGIAKALLVRYVAREDTLFVDLFRRADQLDEVLCTASW
jgi:AcrR family transcriptional regulator